RWTPQTLEYKEIEQYNKRRAYIRALEEVERLIVQRFFELSKANLAATCYKQRKHIASAIIKRSAVVRTALDMYNKLAPLQTPPREPLRYDQLTSYTWLGEVEFLKESHHDILNKEWASLVNRDAANKYFKLLRAKEELVRCNVEARRLQAWIDYEDAELIKRADTLFATDPFLAGHLHTHAVRRRILNDQHRTQLKKLYKLPGFTGWQPVNVRVVDNDVLVEADAGDEGDLADEEFYEHMVSLSDALEAATI
ncbi:hypothetical protein OF83DRAFT_1065430, partial [Amylostereum chailletii]